MNGKKRKTAVLTMAAVLCVMMIASPLAVMAQETAPGLSQRAPRRTETYRRKQPQPSACRRICGRKKEQH